MGGKETAQTIASVCIFSSFRPAARGAHRWYHLLPCPSIPHARHVKHVDVVIVHRHRHRRHMRTHMYMALVATHTHKRMASTATPQQMHTCSRTETSQRPPSSSSGNMQLYVHAQAHGTIFYFHIHKVTHTRISLSYALSFWSRVHLWATAGC